MIELVIIACLAGNCRPHIIPTDGTVVQCAATSIQSVARWAVDNPGWKIMRIECRAYGRDV